MKSDAQVVAEVLAGNQQAYAVLVERYQRAVRAAAVQILGDIHSAEDAAQNAFVKAYQKLASLRNNSAFGAWILKIARTEAISIQRQRKYHQPLDAQQDYPAASNNGLLDEESRLLLDSVMNLPEHEQNVIMLRHFEGHDLRTIADITGRSVGTVSKQLSRAHARLHKTLKEFLL